MTSNHDPECDLCGAPAPALNLLPVTVDVMIGKQYDHGTRPSSLRVREASWEGLACPSCCHSEYAVEYVLLQALGARIATRDQAFTTAAGALKDARKERGR